MNENAAIRAAPAAISAPLSTNANVIPAQLLWHRERGEDDHEYEQVVDRQALLDQVAGEVLRAQVPACERPEDHPKKQRDQHVEDRPAEPSPERDGTAAARRHQQIECEQAGNQRERPRPASSTHMKH
jgi:hypothetical protein